MKFAVQEHMLPPETVSERFALAKKIGFDGVEVWGSTSEKLADELQTAAEMHSIPVSTICAGYGGCPLSSDPGQRQLAMDDIRKILAIAGKFGAVGMIMVPIFGPPQIPDLAPARGFRELEVELLVAELKELAPVAKEHNTCILLESLNRYETHFLNTQQQSFDICEQVSHPNVMLMSDFFHMNIEETDSPNALKTVKKYLKHVHLADNTRMQPGTGKLDFAANFKALKDIGFDGFGSLECSIAGDDKAHALAETLRFLKQFA